MKLLTIIPALMLASCLYLPNTDAAEPPSKTPSEFLTLYQNNRAKMIQCALQAHAPSTKLAPLGNIIAGYANAEICVDQLVRDSIENNNKPPRPPMLYYDFPGQQRLDHLHFSHLSPNDGSDYPGMIPAVAPKAHIAMPRFMKIDDQFKFQQQSPCHPELMVTVWLLPEQRTACLTFAVGSKDKKQPTFIGCYFPEERPTATTANKSPNRQLTANVISGFPTLFDCNAPALALPTEPH